MDENVSNTLYEKLEEIETIKENLKAALISAGGTEYFNLDLKFEQYPEVITSLLGEIQYFCMYFENYINGKDVTEGLKRSEITYRTLLPYFADLDLCKTKLVNILNNKGIYVERDTPLSDIIDLVNILEPPTPNSDSNSNEELSDEGNTNEEDQTEEETNNEDQNNGD